MRRLIMVLAVATTVAVPTSIAVVALAPPAVAGVSLTCAKFSGSETGAVTVKKCAVSKADKKTYKSLGATNAGALANGGTLKWSSSGTTTVVGKPALTSAPAGACSSKDTGEVATGKVTGGTSAVTHAGDTFKVTVCISNSGKIKNAKGTVIEL